ncbi:unnamed protein product [Gordionus sp. m RMFG-2023]
MLAYTINISGPTHVVSGATNVALSCSIMSSKNEIPIWYHDNRRLDITSKSGYQSFSERSGQIINSKLIINRATLDKAGTYKCQSDTNKVLVFQIVVFDSPNEIMMQYKPSKYDEFQEVILQCNANTSILGKNNRFTWKFENGTVIQNDTQYNIGSNTLKIMHPTIKHCGNYFCVSSDIPNIRNPVSIKAPVRVKPLNEQGSLSLVEGDTLKLKCEALSCPKPSILWFRKRDKDESFHPLNSASVGVGDRISFDQDKAEDVENSTLKIKNMGYEDKGLYTCKASNLKSEHNSTINVRIKDKLAALWPFLGICLEVAILCAIILIYEKKRARKNSDLDLNTSIKSPTYKSPDIDLSEDQEIRHRKS